MTDRFEYFMLGYLVLMNFLFILLSINAARTSAAVKNIKMNRKLRTIGFLLAVLSSLAVNVIVAITLFPNSTATMALFILGITSINPIIYMIAYRLEKRKLDRSRKETKKIG